VILVIAIWQALRPSNEQQASNDDRKPGRRERSRPNATTGDPKPDHKQQHDQTTKGEKEKPEKGSSDGQTDKNGKGKQEKDPGQKTKETGSDKVDPKGSKDDPDKVKQPDGPVLIPVAAPNNEAHPAGLYGTSPEVDAPGLLQRDGASWRLLDAKNPNVVTGQPLVSLPGFQGAVKLASGLQLTLWGALPRQLPLPLTESVVQLHYQPRLALDMTLQRGRIFLRNPEARSLTARLRFDNPTNPGLGEVWDVTLAGADTELLLDRWCYFDKDEEFFPDPKAVKRKGPFAAVHLLVLRGLVTLRRDHYPPEEIQALTVLPWNSIKGMERDKMHTFRSVPEWATARLEAPKDADPRAVEQILQLRQLRDGLLNYLRSRGDKVDLALGELLKNGTPAQRGLVIDCLGAIDDLPRLVDALRDPENPDARYYAIEQLARWIAGGLDNDYILQKAVLKKGFSKKESENILELLHPIPPAKAARRDIYEVLIARLDSPKVAIRELAYYRLFSLTRGMGIRYMASGPDEQRKKAVADWHKLLEDGKLPPTDGGKGG
jgi:hypothetical protein